MSLRKVASPKKKPKKVFSRRAHDSYAAAPTKDFWAFKDYARTEIDKKETAKVIKEYIRKSFPKDEAKLMLEAPEWCYTLPYHIASTIVWRNLGHELPENWDTTKVFAEYFSGLKKKGLNKEKDQEPSDETEGDPQPEVKATKSIQSLVSQKASEFICDIEGMLDDYYTGVWIDIDNYSPFLELKKIDAPYNVAKAAYDYYVPLRDEIELAVSKKDKQVEEAYAKMPMTKRKEYLKLLNVIVDDCDKYMQTKKAVRKVRIAKPLTADKQIKRMQFLKDSAEYKLASINPMSVVKAQRLYTFNVKSRVLTEYVSNKTTGFEIKGTTLTNIDLEKSRETRLRKPEEFLQIVMKQTPTKIAAAWNNLTTKTNVPNGRINKDTLLLRVLDR